MLSIQKEIAKQSSTTHNGHKAAALSIHSHVYLKSPWQFPEQWLNNQHSVTRYIKGWTEGLQTCRYGARNSITDKQTTWSGSTVTLGL